MTVWRARYERLQNDTIKQELAAVIYEVNTRVLEFSARDAASAEAFAIRYGERDGWKLLPNSLHCRMADGRSIVPLGTVQATERRGSA